MADAAEIWVVVVEDEHTDPDPQPFTTLEAAVGWAERYAAPIAGKFDCADSEHGVQPLSDAMLDDGWVWLFRYGESRIRVVRRELR